MARTDRVEPSIRSGGTCTGVAPDRARDRLVTNWLSLGSHETARQYTRSGVFPAPDHPCYGPPRETAPRAEKSSPEPLALMRESTDDTCTAETRRRARGRIAR